MIPDDLGGVERTPMTSTKPVYFNIVVITGKMRRDDYQVIVFIFFCRTIFWWLAWCCVVEELTLRVKGPRRSTMFHSLCGLQI